MSRWGKQDYGINVKDFFFYKISLLFTVIYFRISLYNLIATHT